MKSQSPNQLTPDETLFSCPECGRDNFTRRGLLSHKCKPETSTALSVVPKPDLAVVGSEDEQMGAQLTAQYRLAVEGMRHVVRFGAMLMQIREEVESARVLNSAKRGPDTKDTGLKAWMAKYAPEVSESCYKRYLAVAEAVQECCKLPASIKNDAAKFAEFVQSNPEALDEKLRPKQLMLWEEVDGSSQRSWMDRLKAKKARGGNTVGKRDPNKVPEIPATEEETARLMVLEKCQDLYREFFTKSKSGTHQWAHLSEKDQEDLDTMLMDMRADLSDARTAREAQSGTKQGK